MLEKLGWSEDQLKAFSKRMQQRLDLLKDEPENPNADKLQRRRVEELLKSLDLKHSAKDRVGQQNRELQQQDTTTRRSTPPQKYRDWQKSFERGLSEGLPRRKR